MKVNGIDTPLGNAANLEEFLLRQGYTLGHIAVERNEEIVPKDSYNEIRLCDSDKIEIVRFVGGG